MAPLVAAGRGSAWTATSSVALLLALTLLVRGPLPVSGASATNSTDAHDHGPCNTTGTFNNISYTHTFCVRLDLGFNLSWVLSGNNLSVVVRGSPQEPYGWVAFGLAPHCEMTYSNVVMGYGTASAQTPKDNATATTSAAPTSAARIENGTAAGGQFAVGSYYLNSTEPATAVRPAEPTFRVVGGTPAIEATRGGAAYAVRFTLELASTGRQCVVYAKGPALSAQQFALAPIPGFRGHDANGAAKKTVDFSAGTVEDVKAATITQAPTIATTLVAVAIFTLSLVIG